MGGEQLVKDPTYNRFKNYMNKKLKLIPQTFIFNKLISLVCSGLKCEREKIPLVQQIPNPIYYRKMQEFQKTVTHMSKSIFKQLYLIKKIMETQALKGLIWTTI